MPQRLLNQADISALTMKIRSERVSQHVGVDSLPDSSLHSTPLDHLLDVSSRDSSPRKGCEDMQCRMFDYLGLTTSPALKQAKISLSDPEDPILRAFSLANEHLPRIQIQVPPLEPCCFRQSETGIQHQGQHETIALSSRIPWIRLLQKRYLLLRCQYFGELARMSAVCVHQQSLPEVEEFDES